MIVVPDVLMMDKVLNDNVLWVRGHDRMEQESEDEG
jgi:hypothetical protein